MTRLGWGSVLAGVLASAGCGGKTSREGPPDGDDVKVGECSEVSACGGQIAGNWLVVGGCTDLSFVKDALLGCPAAKLVDYSSALSGHAEFGADGKFTLDTTYAGSVSVAVPDSCVEPAARPRACDELAGSLERRGLLLLDSARCYPTESGCFCHLEQRPYERKYAGGYTTRDGALIGPHGEGREYCIEDDTLWLALGDNIGGDRIVLERLR